MEYLLIFTALLLSGCGALESVDFKQVQASCKERDGKYFFLVVPSAIGPRVGAGCMEK